MKSKIGIYSFLNKAMPITAIIPTCQPLGADEDSNRLKLRNGSSQFMSTALSELFLSAMLFKED